MSHEGLRKRKFLTRLADAQSVDLSAPLRFVEESSVLGKVPPHQLLKLDYIFWLLK